MSSHAYQDVLNRIEQLTPDEQFQLLEDLVALVRRYQVKAKPKHNVMEFSGFAKELWKDVDVEKYIDEERNSWDR